MSLENNIANPIEADKVGTIDIAIRRLRRASYALLSAIVVIVVADLAFTRLEPAAAEAVLRAAPASVRSAYIRFVLSVPAGFLRSKGTKVAVLQALQVNQESGRRDIGFDEAQVIELVDPRHGTREMDETSPDECAVFMLASTGDAALVGRALEAHAHDLRAANNARDWLFHLSRHRPDLYAPIAGTVAGFRKRQFERFGGLSQ